jgi:hypothetical protein
MAKKKTKLHQHVKKLRKNKHVKKHLPVGILLLVALVSFLVGFTRPRSIHPESLVWAASQEVQPPSDLVKFLKGQSNCAEGEVQTGGVSLWSIFKVSQGKFAKLSYGCSYDLNFYKMALKEDGKWRLLDKNEYFANSFLPRCSQIDTYKIDKSIEPFCLELPGGSRENSILAE